MVIISLLCCRNLKEEETTDLSKSTFAPANICRPGERSWICCSAHRRVTQFRYLSTCLPELCATGFHDVRGLHIEADGDEMDSCDWFEMRNDFKTPKGSSQYSSHDLRSTSSILQVQSHESECWSHVLLSAGTRRYDSYFAYHRCPSRSGAGFYFERLCVLYSKGFSSCAIPISNAHGTQSTTTTTSRAPLQA